MYTFFFFFLFFFTLLQEHYDLFLRKGKYNSLKRYQQGPFKQYTLLLFCIHPNSFFFALNCNQAELEVKFFNH